MDCNRGLLHKAVTSNVNYLPFCGGSDHACFHLMARPTEEEWVVNDMYEHPKCCENRISCGSVHRGRLVMISYSEDGGPETRTV